MINQEIELIKKYVRAANYISAAQIYLQDNFLLKRPLTFDDIKPRLLGHWGTCPGINFVYAHLNNFIKKNNTSVLFVLGPGHGFPALQANLFLEKTLAEFYPEATNNEAGLGYLCKNFSWPYGFPSHTYPGTPGAILEGGELGYALATSYGAALDNPDLLVACMIGDGEAETSTTAASWHISKFINPATNGIVLPILHLNGYKISGPTLFGRMTNKELMMLFKGYGYHPIIVEGKDVYEKMAAALEKSWSLIKEIKITAQKGDAEFQRLPMIILKTPKGWTGIKRLNGKKIEGNNLSHQVPTPHAKTNKSELKAVEKWLKSYKIEELFDAHTGLAKEITSVIPSGDARMGKNKHAYADDSYTELLVPEISSYCEDATNPGTIGSSSMRRAGLYLEKVFELNSARKIFRLLSPDEIYSNKLDASLNATPRSFELPLKPWDKDLARDGQVIEILNENILQALAQGYILTGRHALLSSYEAFIDIVSSMASQYIKFLKQSREIAWRGAYASFNYILTSSGWRQEHNGFSHQNPAFINSALEKHCAFTKAYFPPDGNSMLAVLKKCLTSRNGVNIIVAGKTVEPRWLTQALAERELEAGLMIWDFASEQDPDIVFVGIGDYMTKECLAAIDLLKKELPQIRCRFVNVMTLSGKSLGNCSNVAHEKFYEYFTEDKPVIFNYHGYPEILQSILFYQKNTRRFSVHGYIEEGSTTTPFDMQVLNKTSRYHLLLTAISFLNQSNTITASQALRVEELYNRKLIEHREYIKKFGKDPQEIEEWQWKKTI